MNRLKELAGYIIAVVVLILFAYYGGFLKGFSAKDFKNMYDDFAGNVTKNANKTGSLLPGQSSSTGSYSGYRTLSIPESALKSSADTGAHKHIFTSSKPVIFYGYDDNDSFHGEMKSYVAKNRMERYYYFVPYERYVLKNYLVGTTFFNKMCNSFEECNAQRKRSQDYNDLANFMESCANTICVINTKKKQYIRLNKRDVKEAKQLLERVKSW